MLRFLRLAVVLHFSLCFAGAVLAQGLPPIVWEGFQSQDINAIAFSPDGALLATASADRTAHLWRVEDGTTLHNLSGHSGEVRSVAFSPDGQLLATSADDNTVRIWRVSDGSLSRMFTQHNAGVACVTFSPNGVHLASGDYSGRVIVWNVSDGSIVRSISNLDIVVQLAFTLSGGELVVASSQWDGFNAYGRLRWIATETGAIVRTIAAGSPITSLAVSPDGLALATIHGACFDCLRGEIKMWRATDGQRIRMSVKRPDTIGGPFEPWLQDTTETQAEFVAASGHVYAFYSLARDNAGNRQLLPGDPRADVNRDGCVDDVDLAIVLGDFGQAGNRDADVNLDGIVDDTDLAIVLINFGSGC
ncbi:MAG: hypothetical protein HUU60_03650 [Armatimonadetes bacterium]|nr:hypothetical protein [Armatimonadota bacterium]